MSQYLIKRIADMIGEGGRLAPHSAAGELLNECANALARDLPPVNPYAVEALASYWQADADGVFAHVSRQAIEECLPALRALAAAQKEPT